MATTNEVLSTLEKNSINEFTKLVNFSKELIIKDTLEAEKYETEKTISVSSAYLEARRRILLGSALEDPPVDYVNTYDPAADLKFAAEFEGTTKAKYLDNVNSTSTYIELNPIASDILTRLDAIAVPASLTINRSNDTYDVMNLKVANMIPNFSKCVIIKANKSTQIIPPEHYKLVNEYNRVVINWVSKIIPIGSDYSMTIYTVGTVHELNDYYLNLHGQYEVDMYRARYAEDFEILKMSSNYLSENEIIQFQKYYIKNLVYFKRVLFTYGLAWSGMYRKFARMFVTFMTIQNMLNDKMETLFDVDTLDEWGVRNLLYSLNIDFLDDLHISIQKKILKNLNDLFRYKGTDKIFSTILNIFGFDNINVYSHYLTRSQGLYTQYNKETGKNELKRNPTEVLQFNRVPYNASDLDSFITNNMDSWIASIEDYDVAIAPDDTWMATREDALKQNFSAIQTKYISVSAAIDLTDLSVSTSYLYTMLCWIKKHVSSTNLSFTASEIAGQSINLLDSFVAIHLISCSLLGFQDKVIPISDKLHSFNLDTTWNKTNDELAAMFPKTAEMIHDYNMNVTSKINMDGFIWEKASPNNPTSNPVESSEVASKYDGNTTLRLVLEKAIKLTTHYESYASFKKDYESLFKSKGSPTTDIYEGHTTLTSYLQAKSPQLLAFINNAKQQDKDLLTGELYLRRAMETIIHAIESFISSTSLKLNVIGTEYIIEYIRKMINYFKAYTVDLKTLEFYYVVDDMAKTIDDDKFFTKFSWKEYIEIYDDSRITSKFRINESIQRCKFEDVEAQYKNSRKNGRTVLDSYFHIGNNETILIQRKYNVCINPLVIDI
jgi:hypothetical protein